MKRFSLILALLLISNGAFAALHCVAGNNGKEVVMVRVSKGYYSAELNNIKFDVYEDLKKGKIKMLGYEVHSSDNGMFTFGRTPYPTNDVGTFMQFMPDGEGMSSYYFSCNQ